jgi:hypothetical protein
MGLFQAGNAAAMDAYIGYYTPYATSHEELDRQPEIFEEVANAAKSLATLVTQIRSGDYRAPDAGLRDPRQK